MGHEGQGRRPRIPGLLLLLRRPHHPRRIREDHPAGLPEHRARQLQLVRRDAQVGADLLLPVPVGPQLPQPQGAGGHADQRAEPGEPGRGGAAHRRRAVHLEAAGHHQPQPAAGAHHRPHAAHRPRMRLPGRGPQGRGGDGPQGARRLFRHPGTPRMPHAVQRLHDGQPVERARQRRHPPAQGADRRVGRPARELLVRQLPALPRRHRLGSGRAAGVEARHRPVPPQGVPVPLLRGFGPRQLVDGRAVQLRCGQRRRPQLRHHRQPVRHREGALHA